MRQQTTVNALVCDYLARFADGKDDQAITEIVAVAQRSEASSGDEGRTWSRAELYDRVVGWDRYHRRSDDGARGVPVGTEHSGVAATEDLAHGADFDGLTVENPFLD